MTGVEILATQEVATAFAFNWPMCVCLTILITAVLTLIGFLEDVDNLCGGWIIGLCIGLVFGSACGIASAKDSGTPTTYETQYKVTISDEVSMNDFLECYEIVSQEGKIYTVREIKNDNQ